jgi:hypothetical protein
MQAHIIICKLEEEEEANRKNNGAMEYKEKK